MNTSEVDNEWSDWNNEACPGWRIPVHIGINGREWGPKPGQVIDMLGKTYQCVPLDRYHPNDKVNTRMDVKFYKELVKQF